MPVAVRPYSELRSSVRAGEPQLRSGPLLRRAASPFRARHQHGDIKYGTISRGTKTSLRNLDLPKIACMDKFLPETARRLGESRFHAARRTSLQQKWVERLFLDGAEKENALRVIYECQNVTDGLDVVLDNLRPWEQGEELFDDVDQ